MDSARGQRLPADARRDQLIREGLELLGRHDYAQMSITELARAAGISKGLLYHYFPTKSEFVVAVLRQARDELSERMTPTDPSLDPVGRMDASLDGFLSYIEEHAVGYQALARARSGQDEAVRAVLAEGRQLRIGQLVNLAAALAGSERESIESPALESVIGGWLAFSEEVTVRWLAEGQLDRGQVRQLLRQSLLGALASVARVDDRPAAARLAEAAERAARASVPSP